MFIQINRTQYIDNTFFAGIFLREHCSVIEDTSFFFDTSRGKTFTKQIKSQLSQKNNCEMNRQNTDLQDQKNGFITPHCGIGDSMQSPPLLLPRSLLPQPDALPNMFMSPFLSQDQDEENKACTIDYPVGINNQLQRPFYHERNTICYYTPENRISIVQENRQNTQEVHFPYLPTLDCQRSSNHQYSVRNNKERSHSDTISTSNAYKRNTSSCLLKPKTRYRRF